MSSTENNLGVSEHPSEKPEVSISIGNHKVTSPLSPDQFSSLKGFLSNHKHGIRIAMELGLVALSAKLLIDSHRKNVNQQEPIDVNSQKNTPLTEAEAKDFSDFFVTTQRKAVGVVMGRMHARRPTEDVYDNVALVYEGLARNWHNYYSNPTEQKEYLLLRAATNRVKTWSRDNGHQPVIESYSSKEDEIDHPKYRTYAPSAEDEALERLEPENDALRIAIVNYLQGIQPTSRISTVLHIAGLTTPEIAQILGETVTSSSDPIKSRWARVKGRLRKIAQDPLAYLEAK